MIDKRLFYKYGIIVCFLSLFLSFCFISNIIQSKEEQIIHQQIVGAERFRPLNLKAYFRGSNAFILTYGINDRQQFENVNGFYKEIKDSTEHKYVMYLVGTKCDLNAQRVISEEEGEKKAKEFNVHFMETSAKMNININELFESIALDLVEMFQSKSESQFDLNPMDNESNEGRKNSSCWLL